jgi:hypothetical protein
MAASQAIKPNALAALEHYKQKDASKGGWVRDDYDSSLLVSDQLRLQVISGRLSA